MPGHEALISTRNSTAASRASADALNVQALVGFAPFDTFISSGVPGLQRTQSGAYSEVPVAILCAQRDSALPFVDVNPVAARLLGYESADELLGIPAQHIYVDLSDHDAIIADLFLVGITSTARECRLRKRDGTTFWASVHAQAIRGGADKTGEICLVVQENAHRNLGETRAVELQADYRALLDHIPAIVYTAASGEPSSVAYVSPQVLDVIGVTIGECHAWSNVWRERLHPDDQSRVLAERIQCRLTGQPLDTEYRMIAKDGRIVWFRDRAKYVKGPSPERPVMHGVMVDITAQREAETATRDREEKLSSLLDSVEDIVWTAKGIGERCLYVNRAIERVYGRPREDFLVNPNLWLEAVHPEDKEQVKKSLSQLAQRGSMELEYRIVRPDGEIRWVLDRKHVVVDRQGNVRYGGVTSDISQRKFAQSALEESEKKFRSLFENAAEGVVLAHAATMKFVLGNPQFCRMLGYSPEEILKMGVPDIHPEQEMEKISRAFLDMENGKPPPTDPVTFRRKDGTRFNAVVLASTLDLAGERYVLGFLRDVSERERAEFEARRYEEQLRSLALELSLAEERERKRLAGHLHDDVAQLLSLAQIRLSLVAPTVERPECKRVVEDLQNLLGRALDSTRSLTFRLSHPALYDLGFVAGAEWLAEDIERLYGLRTELMYDPNSNPRDLRIRVVLYQSLRELLVNAAKHSGADLVRIQIRRAERMLRVIVSDQGAGFDPGIAKKSSTGGFGLFSIRERLNSLGGRADVQSAVGNGTTVTLEIPLEVDDCKGA